MLKVTSVFNDEYFVETLYDGDDLIKAWEIIKNDIEKTCSVEYIVQVAEWWFMNNSEPGEVVHPNGAIDVWTWRA